LGGGCASFEYPPGLTWIQTRVAHVSMLIQAVVTELDAQHVSVPDLNGGIGRQAVDAAFVPLAVDVHLHDSVMPGEDDR